MTQTQRAAAYQLAAALNDALPRGSFDEAAFLSKVLTSAVPDGRMSA